MVFTASHVTTVLVGAWCVVLVWRELLDDGALDPVVEAAETFDAAIRPPPVPAALGNGIVVFSNDVVRAPLSKDGLCLDEIGGCLAVALLAALVVLLGLGAGNPGSLARALLFARSVGR